MVRVSRTHVDTSRGYLRLASFLSTNCAQGFYGQERPLEACSVHSLVDTTLNTAERPAHVSFQGI